MKRGVGGLAAAAAVAAPVGLGVIYAALASLGVVGVGAAGFGIERVQRVLSEPSTWRGLGWTLWVAGASTLTASAAAVLVAVLFRSGTRSSRLARALAIVPLPVPQLVAATAGVLILGQSGYLARLTYSLGLLRVPAQMPALIYDRWGIGLIVTLAWKEFPFLALIAFAVLAIRGAAYEEVARGLGAGRGAVLRRITLPLLWRGMLPAIISVFILQAGAYEATALFAPSDPLPLPLLTLERYTDLDLGARPDAFVLGLVGMTLSIAAVLAYDWARTRWERLGS